MTDASPLPATLDEIDLADGTLFVNNQAHAVFRRLRAEDPVHWQDGNEWFPGFWSVTRYQDIITVSRDPGAYSSAHGIVLTVDPENPDPAQGGGKMLITIDPPRHVRMRRLVNKGFTPRMVAAMEPQIRRITTEILDAIAAKGACDFVTEVAALLPLAVICDMMGLDPADRPKMFELTNKVLGGADPEYQGGIVAEDINAAAQATIMQGMMEMFAYFAQLLPQKAANPRDDLLSVIVESELDGEKLTQEELLYFCYLLILAGNETTRNAISGGLLALFEHPDQRERLQAHPELLPTAVEEILRWVSPVLHMTRVATQDMTLGGKQIKQGEKVVMWYPSANRDEDVFPDPERFDVGRTPNDHLAFGIGEHFCLGAGFARLELRVMFEELLKRFPDIEQAGPEERLFSNFIGGIKHLPVRFTPERAPAAAR
jgi:cholest-4-en-3-one 26-monooxygenase